MSIERIAYPVAEAAAAIGRSRYVLYDAIRRKELPAYQSHSGAEFLILVDDLRAWVTRHAAEPQPRKSRGKRRPR